MWRWICQLGVVNMFTWGCKQIHVMMTTYRHEIEVVNIHPLSCQLILNKEDYWICQGHSVRCRWWGETKTMWSISIVLVKLRPVLVYLLFHWTTNVSRRLWATLNFAKLYLEYTNSMLSLVLIEIKRCCSHEKF